MTNIARVISHRHHADVGISPFQLMCRLSLDSRGQICYALFQHCYNPIHFLHTHHFYLDFFFLASVHTTRINSSINHYLLSLFFLSPSVDLINTRVYVGIILFYFPQHLTSHHNGAYLRDSSRVPQRRPFIYSNHHTPSGHSRVYRGTQVRTGGAHGREYAAKEAVNLRWLYRARSERHGSSIHISPSVRAQDPAGPLQGGTAFCIHHQMQQRSCSNAAYLAVLRPASVLKTK